MKNLKELKGAKVLSKNEQRAIKGGVMACDTIGHNCSSGWTCHYTGTAPDGKGGYWSWGYCQRGIE